MNKPNIILWGNNTFHRVNKWDTDDDSQPKYIQIGVAGTLESWRILTYDEVMQYTNGKGTPCESLIEVADKWRTQ